MIRRDTTGLSALVLAAILALTIVVPVVASDDECSDDSYDGWSDNAVSMSDRSSGRHEIQSK